MKDEKRINLAKKIINNNIYLTLGTADNKIPWTAPLFYAVNNKYEFYFISKKDSLHIKHISNNPKVSFSIFDSHALLEGLMPFLFEKLDVYQESVDLADLICFSIIKFFL